MQKPTEPFAVAPTQEPEPCVLDAALAEGIADAEAGRVTPIGEAFARIRAELGLGDEAGQA
ncbi:hypothetical protein [Methylorubrum sp. SB2]|uniref:hypothetical protein n=1 Tax=Methylorubrum subtropicum TaxID=3138812 RepID=UPI00313AC3D8